jgi:hypothetical protein
MESRDWRWNFFNPFTKTETAMVGLAISFLLTLFLSLVRIYSSA